jgi:hypothetical protein
MRVKINSTLLFMLVLCICGCAANVTNSSDVESYLNSIVGKKYEPPIGWYQDGWKKINETSTSFELEMVKKSGCSYAMKIDKKSNTVEGWRFTSPRSKCDDNYTPLI